MADIYVLWLFRPLPGNYPADQSAAQPVSCFHPLWQFASQACCSAADAVGVRALLCCGCTNVNHASCGGLLVAWFGNCSEVVWEWLCVSTQHTHTICKWLHLNTVCWSIFECVCLSAPSICSICERILAAFLFKPLCPPRAISTQSNLLSIHTVFATLYTWCIWSLLS